MVADQEVVGCTIAPAQEQKSDKSNRGTRIAGIPDSVLGQAQAHLGVSKMNLHIEWNRPVPLRDGNSQNLIYVLDLEKVPTEAGIYIFGRRFGDQFEALYVGKAENVRGRVYGQLNNLKLMQHLRKARSGKRILLAGELITKPGQKLSKCLVIAERALIRYFLSEGHDIVNKHGTRLRRHELESTGNHPKRYFPRVMYLEKHGGS